ncbi:hypothetical protein FXN63_05950 [Pigmentiphaga aceris]|uniref:YfhO family protein n=1 Tax=Pigmentiphaga aceris TaxID=1940612 RepID=A0A5C0AUZ6_9BURK|nr:DUF6311 domain-containing protein [Pigmentiphaga aceris]QEI05434.1 hypothetical protein FXN63_05950 [Pigmentiphaga aceris]
MPPAYAYALAAMLGIALFFELYPVSFLLGHGAFFETSDPSQHVTGWRYFAQDTWHFPLLHTTRLNYPAGVNIAFTDSIPLAALLFKPFVAWLPAGFHYFGLWHALVYVTQALAATFLLRALGVRHAPGLIVAVFMTLIWPALVWRMPHTSLMTHSIILASLGCYVSGREGLWRPMSAALGMVGIALVALLIHPYLFAMSYSLLLMYLVEAGINVRGRERWRMPLILVPLSLVIVMAIAWTLGYLGQSSTTDGFGTFSMNLQAPFCSGDVFPCGTMTPGNPQGEGFNYLGAGVLLLIAAALLTRLRDVGRLLRQYPVLTIGMILFTLYAVSNRIVWQHDVLLSYEVPGFLEKLVNTFRASGRFFWPVGYALLFMALASLLRKPAAWVLPLLLVAMPLQWYDVFPHRWGVRQLAKAPSRGDLQPWQTAMRDIKHINIYPAYGCDDTSEAIYSFLQRVGTHYNVTLDTGHIARSTPDCALNQDRFTKPFADDTLYVMAAAKLDKPLSITAGFRQAIKAGQCGINGEMLVCRSAGKPADWSGPLDMKAVAPTMTLMNHWNGAELPSLVGKPEGTSMVASQEGILSYGPYTTLLPGRYRFRIQYRGDAPREVEQARWDIQYTDAQNVTTEQASGAMPGTASEAATIDGIITVPRGHAGRWEIRTRLLGADRMQLIGLDIEPD